MPEPAVSFGDRVRIVSDPTTEATGFAGRFGAVYGWTTPSVTSVDVVGGPDGDFAYNVGFEGEGVDAWFAPRLVALVDHSPGMEITVGDEKLVRDASGEWKQPKRRFGRRPK